MTIKQRQHLLAYLGYYVGPVDGEWGSGSRAACTAFQQDFGGIKVDGHGGTETDKALKHAVAYDMFKVDISNEETTTGSFWDEIQYFTRDEFRCKCGGKYCNGFPAEPKEQLIKLLDEARAHFGSPARVISGLRCSSWNSIQGGVEASQHMYGEAADIRIDGVTADALLAFFQGRPGVRYAYKINATNVHVDIPKGGR